MSHTSDCPIHGYMLPCPISGCGYGVPLPSIPDQIAQRWDPLVHELKCWPNFFEAVWLGKKLCEFRIDDRGYRAGDRLLLREWKPETEEYTGRSARVTVTDVTRGAPGMPPNYCLMSIADLERRTP